MLAAVVPTAGGFGAKGGGREEELGKGTTLRNFFDALLAVLAGNAIYFLIMPHLPAAIRHSLFKEDWGLLVDFVICTVIFVAVKFFHRADS